MRITILIALLTAPVTAPSAFAAAADVPPPPAIPPGYHGDKTPTPTPPTPKSAPKGGNESGEPEVTITTRGTDRVEEYRYNGQLYMMKITPKSGIPYYLIDEEGRGQFRRSDLQPRVSPPMWVLKRF